MRKTLIVGVTLALMCGSALAQTQAPPTQQGPGNRAINTEGANNSNAPVAGANSFTESQAKCGWLFKCHRAEKRRQRRMARQSNEGW
jgi:hypothetical protein